MYWGHGTGGWGIVLMTVATLLFWGLVIGGIVALVRYAGRGAPKVGSTATTATPQEILAERVGPGEIDEGECTRQIAVLGVPAKTRAGG